MGLLDRARDELRERNEAGRDDARTRRRSEAVGVAQWVTRLLELTSEPLASSDLRPLTERRQCNLFGFEREGIHFIAGIASVGVLGGPDIYFLGVRVDPGAPAKPEQWPPPEEPSAANRGWAPAGYRAVWSLADLAAALDA